MLARFVSPDSIVPGTSAGSGGAAATVGSGFRSQLSGVNAQRQGQGFWFELDREQKKEAESPDGPANPQALNRYVYGLNNPVKYTDPTGHWVESALDIAAIAYDIYMLRKEGMTWKNALALAADIVGLGLPAVTGMGMIVRAGGRGARIYELLPRHLAGRAISTLDKHALNSMAKRGWTKEEIVEAIQRGQAHTAIDKTAGNAPATRFVHPETGKSVVINNETGRVIHVGDIGYGY